MTIEATTTRQAAAGHATAEERDTDQALVSLEQDVARWARERPDATAMTFVDYAESEHGVASSLTWSELDAAIDRLAVRLQRTARVGDRVAVMTPQGLGFGVAFFAAQRIGAIPVPLFQPGLPGHGGRLVTTLEDCEPSVLVVGSSDVASVRAQVAEHGWSFVTEVVSADEGEDGQPDRAAPQPHDVGYLQYTSGSTSAPRGVVIRHSHVRADAFQGLEAYEVTEGCTLVSWLPLFHDMGFLVSLSACVVSSTHSVIFDPIAFLQKPSRWLRLLSDHPGAVTAAPNFAYGYAASRVTPDEIDWLQLDQVRAMANGAEPVHAETIDAFHDTFAEAGLQRHVHRHSYGLAEAVVFVSVSPAGREPARVQLDREALAAGRAEKRPPGAADTMTLVSCGHPLGQEVLVVDPATDRSLPEGQVGEIRVCGPNVADCYWSDPTDTDRVFSSRVDEDPDRAWLRTGDLGVVVDGELYVTGRIKDLIVVGGRNHYPQDVELTVEQAHGAVRRRNVAAFAVTVEESERMVVVAERARGAEEPADAVAADVRAAVSRNHGVSLHQFVMVAPGEIPRTSSGKISRSATRDLLAAGRWA